MQSKNKYVPDSMSFELTKNKKLSISWHYLIIIEVNILPVYKLLNDKILAYKLYLQTKQNNKCKFFKISFKTELLFVLIDSHDKILDFIWNHDLTLERRFRKILTKSLHNNNNSMGLAFSGSGFYLKINSLAYSLNQ